MKIKNISYKKLNIFGCYLISPKLFKDDRGSFQEIYNEKNFYKITGIKQSFKQNNISVSNKNVLRGLHFQIKKPQGKLIKVLNGSIFDVFVDLRKKSPTYKKVQAISLNKSDNLILWLPPGIAHGFYSITSNVILNYKVTELYDPKDEYTLKWNDENLKIKWPSKKPILSKKDKYECLSFYNVLDITN
tara:strand:- start:13569 stop:14132 length:564 start_codon:yes stop_codon:yes gene_type:complete